MRSGKYYRGIKIDGKKVDYHRYVMEQKLGRPLSRYEVVHHKDENKQNNDIENLELMTLPEHSRKHMAGYELKQETKDKMRAIHTGRPNYALRKLSDAQIKKAVEMLKSGMTYREVARQFEVHHSTIMRYYRMAKEKQ